LVDGSNGAAATFIFFDKGTAGSAKNSKDEVVGAAGTTTTGWTTSASRFAAAAFSFAATVLFKLWHKSEFQIKQLLGIDIRRRLMGCRSHGKGSLANLIPYVPTFVDVVAVEDWKYAPIFGNEGLSQVGY
jgi:hypothetical protein